MLVSVLVSLAGALASVVTVVVLWVKEYKPFIA
jgi:hypothetical protein